MTSKNIGNIKSEVKKGPKSEDLDMIANYMDTILSGMKQRIQSVKKNNSSKDEESFSSDFENLMSETRKEMISDIDRPMKFTTGKRIENIKQTPQLESPEKAKLSNIILPNTKVNTSSKDDENNKTAAKNPIKKKSSPPKLNNSSKAIMAQNQNVFVMSRQNEPVIETVPNTPVISTRPNSSYISSNRSKSMNEKVAKTSKPASKNQSKTTTTNSKINKASDNLSVNTNKSKKSDNKRKSKSKATNIFETISNSFQAKKKPSLMRKNLLNQKNKFKMSNENAAVQPLKILPAQLHDRNSDKKNSVSVAKNRNVENTSKGIKATVNKVVNNQKSFVSQFSHNYLNNMLKKTHEPSKETKKSSTTNPKKINIFNRINFQNKSKNDIKSSNKENTKHLDLKNASCPQKLDTVKESLESPIICKRVSQGAGIHFMKQKPEKLEIVNEVDVNNNRNMVQKENVSTSTNEVEESKVQCINNKIVDIVRRIKEQKELNTLRKKIQVINENITKNNCIIEEVTSDSKDMNSDDTSMEYRTMNTDAPTTTKDFSDFRSTIDEKKNNDDPKQLESVQDLEKAYQLIKNQFESEIKRIEKQNEFKFSSRPSTVKSDVRIINNQPKQEIKNKPASPPQKNINNNNNNIKKSVQQSPRQNIIIQSKYPSKLVNKASKLSAAGQKVNSLPKVLSSGSQPKRVISVLSGKNLNAVTPMEVIQDYVNLVNKAKKEKKTFTVCGNFFSIRRSFLDRGWIEKLRVNLMDDKDTWRRLEGMSNFELVEGMKDKEKREKYRRVFLSKLLAGHQVDFYWDYMTNPFSVNNDKIKRTIINRFPFGATRSYTSKAGLCDSLNDAYWYYIDGYSNILFPRTYNLSNEEEIQSFINDFHFTAIISLLQWISTNASTPSKIMSSKGEVPSSVFNFATLQCHNYIKIREHKDIDEVIPAAKEYEWDVFLEKFYKIVHQEQHFKETEKINASIMVDQSRYLIGKIKKYLPNLYHDGHMNLWLLKPNNGSRGSGIHVCRTLKYALDVVHTRKETKYVIQKYIERPLLIHKTKFDIRQWFLVTCIPNLHVWLYKDCYLRFSSQMYDLNKLHESIHLTNNSIQCRYRNNINRSNMLPEQNMWHSDTFRRYLSDIGHPFAWRNIIYKGIKECLIGLFMLCQDKLVTRINSFELCGADFMITEDFHPYLIEINSRPALYPSTKVTARMCPQVLEDVVKVTVDYARNSKAPTGNFELIYKDTFNYIPQRNEQTFIIEGLNYFTKFAKNKLNLNVDAIEQLAVKSADDYTSSTLKKILNLDPKKVRKDVKHTLEKILEVIHTEKNTVNENMTESDRNLKFKEMLSEFVDIITSIKNKPRETAK